MKGFRMTWKYKAARAVGEKIGLSETEAPDQETLYGALNRAGQFWNAKTGEWEWADPGKGDAPSDVIRVRVTAAMDVVEEAAGQIRANLGGIWPCIEQSNPYSCWPPKQHDSRIYLTFKPKKEA